MAEPSNPLPEKQPDSHEQPTSTSRSWLSFANLIPGLLIGVLVGLVIAFYVQGWLPKITQVLIIASYVTFGVLVISFVLMFGFREYITRSIFGTSAAKVGTVVQDVQKAADYLTDKVANQLLKDATPDVRQGVRSILPRLANLFVWARLRNWWWQWILGIFVAIGGLTGTVLLMNQNELLNNQNTLIQRQMSLEEATRRSALIVLMSNIMDKVDREIEEQKRIHPKNTVYSLSQSLVGQIASLSHSFKPYRYLNGDTLISQPLSPERGQLLITLIRLPFDSITLLRIYTASTFSEADLQEAVLSEADLSEAVLAGADLREADLSGTFLRKSVLGGANLSMAYFGVADLSGAYLRETCLRKADFIWADLTGADLTGADMTGANLAEANLSGANLTGADLTGADLSIEQAGNVVSLYNCRGLHDSIKSVLVKTHPQLFEESKESSR